MNLTTTLSSRAPELFDLLTDEVNVRKSKYKIRHHYTAPFDFHLAVLGFVPDDCFCAEDAYKEYIRPAIKELAQNIQWYDTLEVEALPLVGPNLGQVCWVTDGRIPLRVTAWYDCVQQVTKFSFEALVRYVGDYHRMIINGPLHRHKMPFSYDPVDGHEFDYLYLPMEKKNYDMVVFDDDDDDDEGTVVRLPGLETCVEDDSIHRYRVRGDYCYYMGETLRREASKL